MQRRVLHRFVMMAKRQVPSRIGDQTDAAEDKASQEGNIASFESHSVFDFRCNLRSIQKELGLKSSMISLPVEHDRQGNISTHSAVKKNPKRTRLN